MDVSAERRVGLAALLTIQLIIGYEWLMSGITKVASGTFISGLGAQLRMAVSMKMNTSPPGFYRSFLRAVVIPNVHAFALLVELGELLVGAAFISVALYWLLRRRVPAPLLATGLAAALIAALMSLNFHFFMGAGQPWQIPSQGFDETIDLDTVLAMVQLSLAGFYAYLLYQRALAARADQRSVWLTLRPRGRAIAGASGVLLALVLASGAVAAASGAHRKADVHRARPSISTGVADVGKGPVNRIVSAGPYRLDLRISPNNAGRHNQLSLSASDTGRPVSDAVVQVRFGMPAMAVSNIYDTSLRHTMSGTYRAYLPVLGMPGEWQMHVTVSSPQVKLSWAVNDQMR